MGGGLCFLANCYVVVSARFSRLCLDCFVLFVVFLFLALSECLIKSYLGKPLGASSASLSTVGSRGLTSRCLSDEVTEEVGMEEGRGSECWE